MGVNNKFNMAEDTVASTEHPVVTKAKDLRTRIKVMNQEILAFKEMIAECPTQVQENRGEQLANVMLAYRHGEDCRMRLGKVIEHKVGFNAFDKK